MILRQPMNPVVQNALILVMSGLVASVFCAKVYGATLPVDEPTAVASASTTTTVATPAPRAHDDGAAAAALRAMLAGQQPLFGVAQADAGVRR